MPVCDYQFLRPVRETVGLKTAEGWASSMSSAFRTEVCLRQSVAAFSVCRVIHAGSVNARSDAWVAEM